MKKHEIARENVMTTVGRVTVAVYATDSTDKQTLSTVLYDGKSQLVSGISAQMTYRPGSGLALEDAVKNIIARTSTKYEASQRPLCEHIDYAQAYADLKSANMLHQLCPVEWRAESTRRAALTYYERRSIPLIQHILNRMGDPLALPEAQQNIWHWHAAGPIAERRTPSKPPMHTSTRRTCCMKHPVISCRSTICRLLRSPYL